MRPFTHYSVVSYSDGRRIVITGHTSRQSAERLVRRALRSGEYSEADTVTVEPAAEWLRRAGQNISVAEDWPGDKPYLSDSEVSEYVQLLKAQLAVYVTAQERQWLDGLDRQLRDDSPANSFQRCRLERIMDRCAREYGH